MSEWHTLNLDAVFAELESRPDGLEPSEIRARRERYGPNELVERQGRGPWRILWEQLCEPMVFMLIIAACVSAAIREYPDAAAIAVIVVLNALLGFVQDYRAERALAALKQLAVPEVTVRRHGTVMHASAVDLVPGDVILLDAGSRVPADCRVVESRHLQLQEAAITGESQPVTKRIEPLSDANSTLGDRKNMLYMGTEVSAGRGEAVVTAIGMQTELGNIADMLQRIESQQTPLQRRLARMSVGLAMAALAIVGIVFALGLLRGQDLTLMLMTALSMAVAAVPEGLPAVATIALALGAKRMLRRQALIRRLPAVETLGSVTVICSDKTGTLTQNRMGVSVLRSEGFELDLQQQRDFAEDSVDEADPHFREFQSHPSLALTMLVGVLCNDARLSESPIRQSEDTPTDASGAQRSHPRDRLARFEPSVEGDPTESAFVLAALRYGASKPELDDAFPRVAECPFDPIRKRMTTVHACVNRDAFENAFVELALQAARQVGSGTHLAVLKGAVDSVLQACQSTWTARGPQSLNEAVSREILAANDELAASGKRVLGLAVRWLDSPPTNDSAEALEHDFTFVGLAGLADPPRREAEEAVRRCKTAGIRAVMITGDHPLTAGRIAAEVGIDGAQGTLTGQDLEAMSDAELAAIVDEVSVYARVSPEHKLRIVKALQTKGNIVAMTGDGVNDAPALKIADIGVAMGITGTDVSKDASEAVLLDDNFATIVNSVEEGRIIYDDIRKFLKYTLTSNAGEIWVMLLAPFTGMPLPLVPLQILWVNLVTDGLPGLAMAVEPGERNIMQRPPRNPQESILDRSTVWHIAWVGLLMGIVSLGIGYWYWLGNPTTSYNRSWGTIVFTVLTFSQMGHALAVRSAHDSLFRQGVFSNPAMMASVLLTLSLQLAVIYVPALQHIFRTTPLSPRDLLVCATLSTVVFWAVECEKWLKRRRDR